MGLVFSVVGGDGRFEYLRETLSRRFVCIHDFTRADAVVLPLPLLSADGCVNGTSFGADELCSLLRADCLVFSGAPVEGAGSRVFVYGRSESFLLPNAALTAEGALEILLRKSKRSAEGANVLVTGYGRVARAVCGLFSAVGARITVAARSAEARRDAARDGFDTRGTEELCGCFDAVVNTVPAQIIGESLLEGLTRECVLIELASKPYGFNFECAAARGLEIQLAPGLPGKTAPRTAGEIIYKTIMGMLESEGLL